MWIKEVATALPVRNNPRDVEIKTRILVGLGSGERREQRGTGSAPTTFVCASGPARHQGSALASPN